MSETTNSVLPIVFLFCEQYPRNNKVVLDEGHTN